MRGILGHAAYLPYRRLDRTTIAAVAGAGGGKGTRTVASYDEDTTTMAVEAARLLPDGLPAPAALYFATTQPTYLDKTNATAIHAALRLPVSTVAADFGGALRSWVAAFRVALGGSEAALVVAADIRTGLPGGPDEAAGGDGAAAVLVGDGDVVAEYLGGASATAEFVDRWRVPGAPASKQWEERFGDGEYAALGEQAYGDALKACNLTADDVDDLIVVSTHQRAAAALAKRLAGAATTIAGDLSTTVGHTGAAHAGLVLSAVLEDAGGDRIVALVSLADGSDVLVFNTVAGRPGRRTIDAQIAGGGPIAYGKFLAWRGMLPVEPPRRPEPARVSSSAAARNLDWKYGLEGEREYADATGVVATFTVDRLAYSPSPPIVFAVVDFDGGGRLPVELTDVDAGDVAIGQRVEMTFRRLSTADGIANYFWKARPIR